MAQLTRQTALPTGVTPAYQACAGGGDLAPIAGGKTFLHFLNTNAAARNVTLNSITNCNQGFDHDIVVNVPATVGTVIVGPIATDRFADANGNVALTYDAVTNLSVAV